MIICKAAEADKEATWNIIQAVIASGDTYVFAPDSSKEEMLAYWFNPGTLTYVAKLENEIVGTFILKENQPGLGSHELIRKIVNVLKAKNKLVIIASNDPKEIELCDQVIELSA